MLELNKPPTAARGFTLIELMVTVALAAILMMVAVPSFTTYLRNSQLTSFTNTLLSAANAARGEAMKRGVYAMVVPNGTSWDSGWIVFVDVNRDKEYVSTNDVLILSSDAKPSFLTITGNGTAGETPPYILYDPSGYAKTKDGGFGASTFEVKRNDVSTTDELSQTRRLKIAATGRARICTPKASTDTTCQSLATAN